MKIEHSMRCTSTTLPYVLQTFIQILIHQRYEAKEQQHIKSGCPCVHKSEVLAALSSSIRYCMAMIHCNVTWTHYMATLHGNIAWRRYMALMFNTLRMLSGQTVIRHFLIISQTLTERLQGCTCNKACRTHLITVCSLELGLVA